MDSSDREVGSDDNVKDGMHRAERPSLDSKCIDLMLRLTSWHNRASTPPLSCSNEESPRHTIHNA